MKLAWASVQQGQVVGMDGSGELIGSGFSCFAFLPFVGWVGFFGQNFLGTPQQQKWCIPHCKRPYPHYTSQLTVPSSAPVLHYHQPSSSSPLASLYFLLLLLEVKFLLHVLYQLLKLRNSDDLHLAIKQSLPPFCLHLLLFLIQLEDDYIITYTDGSMKEKDQEQRTRAGWVVYWKGRERRSGCEGMGKPLKYTMPRWWRCRGTGIEFQ